VNARILVVDNDPRRCRALTRTLRAMDFQVVAAGDVPAAYLVLEERPVDVVLLDLHLESAMGDALGLALMRQWPHLRGRVILMSSAPPAADSWPAELERCPFLLRPVAAGALAQTLARVLASPPARQHGTA
jgi:DNA-binding NtrC family response regulator